MEAVSKFEYPLPIIKASIDKIVIISSGSCSGKFIIRNAGGSDLKGTIASSLRGLSFSPSRFEGNSIEITYNFKLDIYKRGDVIKSSVVIMSNGGEIIIPIIARIIPPAIETEDGDKLVSLEDYMFFTKKNPVESGKIFKSKVFETWLRGLNYESMDMYMHLKQDAINERAVENFLIYNNLKNKPKVTVLQKEINMTIRSNAVDPVTAVIPLKLEGWGYVNTNLDVMSGVNWLKVITDKISYNDFDENGFYEVSILIYPALIKGRAAFDKITLFSDVQTDILVTVIKERDLSYMLSKESFLSEDSGKILVRNKSGKDLMLEVATTEQYIKFEGSRYLVGEYAEIPFSIKMTMIQLTPFALKKQPVINSDVYIKAVDYGTKYSKKLSVNIGRIDSEK